MLYLVALLILVIIGAAYFVKRQKRRPSLVQVPPPKGKQVADPATLSSLRQNLRLKVSYNEATIDRLIELEREKLPDAPLQTLMEAAIERWERDNR